MKFNIYIYNIMTGTSVQIGSGDLSFNAAAELGGGARIYPMTGGGRKRKTKSTR